MHHSWLYHSFGFSESSLPPQVLTRAPYVLQVFFARKFDDNRTRALQDRFDASAAAEGAEVRSSPLLSCSIGKRMRSELVRDGSSTSSGSRDVCILERDLQEKSLQTPRQPRQSLPRRSSARATRSGPLPRSTSIMKNTPDVRLVQVHIS